MGEPEFCPDTREIRSELPAKVAEALRTDLPRRLSHNDDDLSNRILDRLMQNWTQTRSKLFLAMLHYYAYEMDKPEEVYGPTEIRWVGSQLIATSEVLPFADLPLRNYWKPFLGTFLDFDNGDYEWFDHLLAMHDLFVSGDAPS